MEWIVSLVIISIAINLICFYLLSKQKFIIKLTEDEKSVEITPKRQVKNKMEFIGEPDQRTLDEIQREPALNRFLKGFKKPNITDEDDDLL